MSIYPIFSKEGEESIPSYSVIRIGTSSEECPALDNEVIEVNQETKHKWFVNNYFGLVLHLSKLGPKHRINYKSKYSMIYSRFKQDMPKESEELFTSFEIPLLLLEENFNEEIKKELCEKIQGINGHYCNICTEEEDKEKDKEKQQSASTTDEELETIIE